MEIKKLKEEIKKIQEPRRTGYGNIRHKLEDIIIIGQCTVICGGEDFDDMEGFRQRTRRIFAEFLELPHGIPESDTFRACLVSSKNNTNKSKGEHLKRISKKSFAVFPKSAAFVKPAK